MKVLAYEQVMATPWPDVIKALSDGHQLPRARTGDTLIELEGRKMLVRSAWIDGLAAGVKAVTIVPANTTVPSVQGEVLLFDDKTGTLAAALDGAAITALKTAADSALGSKLLSRREAASLLMVGAGAMAEPLIRAHLSVRPSITQISLWNRTGARAEELAGRLEDTGCEIHLAEELPDAVSRADIISCATMTETPLVRGEWLRPGCHLDLVGAYTPTMREADDIALQRARIFVDCYDTTLEDIGEIRIPLANGVISRDDILADLYDLAAGAPGRISASDITLFKNGGGAHLDIMTANAVMECQGI